jgi:hypothetical protein
VLGPEVSEIGSLEAIALPAPCRRPPAGRSGSPSVLQSISEDDGPTPWKGSLFPYAEPPR